MNICESNVRIIKQRYSDELIEDMYRHIEICGRNCYKSEDRITETSYKKFVDNLMKLGHGAMLEHGTIYLVIPVGTPFSDNMYMSKIDAINFFSQNKYSKVVKVNASEKIGNGLTAQYYEYFITTNYRVIYENLNFTPSELESQFKFKKYEFEEFINKFISKPRQNHALRHTVEFTYHLAAARDVNRHRVQSVAEESTRYCDYTKEKFGNGLNIVPPERFTAQEAQRQYELHMPAEGENIYRAMISDIYDGTSDSWTDIDWWLWANISAENTYAVLKNQFGWSNQECSLVLPLGTRTCSIHTAYDTDWVHFFNLRALGSTGAPRPSIKKLAIQLMETFIKNRWINPDDLDQKYYKIYEESKCAKDTE